MFGNVLEHLRAQMFSAHVALLFRRRVLLSASDPMVSSPVILFTNENTDSTCLTRHYTATPVGLL